MIDYSYISSIFNNIGILINQELRKETIYNFPLVFSKKSIKFEYQNSYSIYSQPLGTFLIDFMSCNLDSIDDFKNFFLKYSFSLLSTSYKKNITKKTYTQIEFNQFLSNIYSKKIKSLKRIQRQLDEIIDYCIINPQKKDITILERFIMLSTVHENFSILKNVKIENLSFYNVANYIISNPSESEMYKILSESNHKIKKITVSIPHNIESLLYYTLSCIMEEQLFFKVCNNCNNYFISSNSKKKYCDRIAPNSDKLCSEIGRRNKFKVNIISDPLLDEYYKIYHKYSILAARNPDITSYTKDYNTIKRVGTKKVNDYKNNKISKDEFREWLDKKR